MREVRAEEGDEVGLGGELARCAWYAGDEEGGEEGADFGVVVGVGGGGEGLQEVGGEGGVGCCEDGEEEEEWGGEAHGGWLVVFLFVSREDGWFASLARSLVRGLPS